MDFSCDQIFRLARSAYQSKRWEECVRYLRRCNDTPGVRGLRSLASYELKLHYAVQVALYVDILERLGLSAARRGFIWDINGDEVPYDLTAPLGPKNPQTLWDKYQEALIQCRAVLAKQVTQLSAYASVCKLCHWCTYCVEQLTAADDLTLIPFLGRSVRDSMKDEVPTIAALASRNPDAFMKGKKTIFPGVGQDRLRLFYERAWRGRSGRLWRA
jgi:hypothetical protein